MTSEISFKRSVFYYMDGEYYFSFTLSNGSKSVLYKNQLVYEEGESPVDICVKIKLKIKEALESFTKDSFDKNKNIVNACYKKLKCPYMYLFYKTAGERVKNGANS